MYFIGLNFFKDQHYELSKIYFEALDKYGDGRGAYGLWHYYTSYEKNEKLVEKYMKRSAELGNTVSEIMYGSFLIDKGDLKEAEKWLLKAVEKGDDDAICILGMLYGEMKKYDLAEKYYLMAIEKGNYSAMNSLGEIYEK